MREYTFWKVIKGNIECALCKEEKCPLRYYPNHKRYTTDMALFSCKKEWEKKLKNI